MTAGNPAPQSPLVAPISWADLIGAARKLLNPTPPATGVTDAAIRRAVSTAYYAMFHALLASNANSLVGPHTIQPQWSHGLASIATQTTEMPKTG